MGRGGFHGLATDHLDDVDFINIQPVIKTSKTEPGRRTPSRKGFPNGEKSRNSL